MQGFRHLRHFWGRAQSGARDGRMATNAEICYSTLMDGKTDGFFSGNRVVFWKSSPNSIWTIKQLEWFNMELQFSLHQILNSWVHWLVGGFNCFYFQPGSLGKMNPSWLYNVFKWVETTNQLVLSIHCVCFHWFEFWKWDIEKPPTWLIQTSVAVVTHAESMYVIYIYKHGYIWRVGCF